MIYSFPSFIFSNCFFLVMVQTQPEPFLGTLSM